MILSKYAICAIKKIKYVQKQETSRLLSKLRAKVSLSKASILADILFWWVLERRYKTNEVINKVFFIRRYVYTWNAFNPFFWLHAERKS